MGLPVKNNLETALYTSVRRVLDDQVLTSLSDKTGIEQAQLDRAIDAGLTAVLGGLRTSVKQPDEAAKLDAAITQDHLSDSFKNLAHKIEQGTLQTEGEKILTHIFKPKSKDAMRDYAAKAAGTSSIAMDEVMSVLAPLILGKLGQAKQDEGLDATGVADKILKQQLPKGQVTDMFIGLLDRDRDGQIIDDIIELGSGIFRKK